MAEGLERVRVSAAELRDMVAAQARAAGGGDGGGEGVAATGGVVVEAGSCCFGPSRCLRRHLPRGWARPLGRTARLGLG